LARCAYLVQAFNSFELITPIPQNSAKLAKSYYERVPFNQILGNQIQDRFAKAFSYLEKNYRTFPPNKRNDFLVTSHPDVGTDFRKTFPKEAKNILRVMRAVNPFHCEDPKIEDDIIISSYFHRNAPPASMNNKLGFRRIISK
jgi:hypothetical protein